MNKPIYLKKNEQRRIQAGHPWVYSNEIDSNRSPLKNFTSGELVCVLSANERALGLGYINPHSLIAIRMLTSNIEESIGEQFFIQRLQTALLLRQSLFDQPYYRLVYGEGDQLPGLVIDRYADHLAVQMNTAGMDACQNDIIAALRAILPNTKSILLRNDSPARLQEGLEQAIQPIFGSPPEIISVYENGCVFHAPFLQGQKTGWFYDQRLNRAMMQGMVVNKNVLDVFSYLGGFGIQAAKFGAKKVTCVDASARAAEFITQNAQINEVSNKVGVICEDAFDALDALNESNQRYDYIIVDPPAFVKKAKDKNQGLRAYQRINEKAFKLLNNHGLLLSCSCSMHVSMQDLQQILQKSANHAGCNAQLITRGHQATDHPVHIAVPETDYLKAILVRKIAK